MKTWVIYYLFFRLFRNAHNIIGILLILNDTPVYYKPTVKMVIFIIFEQFELWWMVYGINLFFVSGHNTCLHTEQNKNLLRLQPYDVRTQAQMIAMKESYSEL